MKRVSDFLKETVQTIKNVTVGRDKKNYALVFGIVFSFILAIENILYFFFLNPSLVMGKLIYLVMSILFFIVYILFNFAYRKKTARLTNYLNALFPYMIIISGVLAVCNTIQFDAAINPFLFKIFIVAFMQIYTNKERNFIAFFSYMSFNFMTFLTAGNSAIFRKYLLISLQGIVVTYLLSYVLYLIYTHHAEAIKRLDLENQKLEKTYEDLKTSHEIVESMFNLTQEILENEHIEDVMQLVLEESIDLVKKAHAGSILVKDGKKMKFIAAKGYDLNNLRKVDLNFEDTFQANLDDLYEPTIISDLETFDISLWGEEKFDEFKEKHIIAKSCLSCSFRYKDNFFGSINLDNFEDYEIFDENDKYLIKKLAQEIEVILSIHKLYEHALEPARVDSLTGIYNRSYVLKKLDYKLRDIKGILSVCIIDINDLKSINDSYGHLVGDEYLKHFTESIKTLKRKEDLFGRVGGDEFIIIFEGYDYHKTLEFLKTIKQHFEKNLFVFEAIKIELKFGAGISEYPKDGTTVNDLFRNADKKMYIDKLISKQ